MLSITNFVIGPAVSNVEIGTIPDLLTEPIVGFIPTREFEDEGDNIDPEVSRSIETELRFDAVATPLPELEPPVSNFFLPYGFNVSSHYIR